MEGLASWGFSGTFINTLHHTVGAGGGGVFIAYTLGASRSHWPLACWDCGFESPLRPECFVWVLCVVRSLCDGPISRLEEFYRLWRVIVCDLEA